ncbi:MAG: PTS sugar transporter subunit IIB [Candidatus Latescibacteria bacterium]|nr:PTS sugar transporter subunit IIB [Candidatus Latescibacterota bacterium]
MSIILARIDDRLIHGQVTEGWGKVIAPKSILVVSDTVSLSDWECELCLAALPSYIGGKIVKLDEAVEAINKLDSDQVPSYVLFESPKDAFEVIKNGAHISELNVGGMHSSKDKREVLDYIYVDDDDTFYLQALRDLGVKLDFRDLPGHNDVDVLTLLNK